ncbi:WD repeat-containing protein slp1 [Tieghemiomyces parasiticus]|uniref:WD repeat-containing protein slp1 n=1 Tax=Tieghemiomyces parasiticus TaxID=78921 RepID=A0A9W8AHH6_9FUNG|nr:WD repeat-containing protein slp1 [Tieghemiomyces parasiticus]
MDSSASPKKAKKPANLYDRFIPNRSSINVSSAQFNLSRSGSGTELTLDTTANAYQEEVARACGISLDKRILAFKSEPPPNEKEDLRQTYGQPLKSSTTASANAARSKRRILTAPERILDAPGLLDDYYLNLLDWSATNLLAIGLNQSVYVWNGETGDVVTLCQVETPGEYVASVQWTADGSYLAVGTSDGDTQIWDPETQRKMRSMAGHQARVSALAWDKHILSSGCRDGSIWHHDVRVATHKVAELRGHTSEVCGLAWRPDGAVLASGGNDNLVNIWDVRSQAPKFTKANHTAAVKAVAWCPWQQNLLATGGGAHDRHIHFWNTTTAARLHSVDTGSQVTSIRWSTEYKEFVSSHGFPDNQLSVWSYPALTKVADIPAHDTRVLHTALSPDGQTIATVSSDDNLKFWRVFEAKPKAAKSVKAEPPPRHNSLEFRATKLR